jgi:hypothetical protein
MEIDDWAIINTGGGWLEMVVRWDGNTSTWQPPEGTYAVRRSEMDLSTLPLHPDILNDPVEIILDIEEAGTY